MKNYLVIVLFIMLFGVFVAQAQEPTVAPDTAEPTQSFVQPAETQEPAVTQEAAATQEIVSTPDADVIINVEAPDVPADPPASPSTDDSSPVFWLGWVAALLFLFAFLTVVVLLVRELREKAATGNEAARQALAFYNASANMLPVDSWLQMLDKLDERAKATRTPFEIDDKLSGLLKALGYELKPQPLPDDPVPPSVPDVPPSAGG